MNSIFCGVKADDISASSWSPLNNFCALVSIVNTVPVATEYNSFSTASPFSSTTVLPLASTFLTQFLRSRPIPPVTSTVVRKIGAIPFVPATIGAILIKGTYGLACLPVNSATLLTPDIRDEPTPIVPFSAISITFALGCLTCSALISA